MALLVAGMTRVVLETKPNPTFSVSLEPNPYRLVVEVRKIGANRKGAVNLFPNANTTIAILLGSVYWRSGKGSRRLSGSHRFCGPQRRGGKDSARGSRRRLS